MPADEPLQAPSKFEMLASLCGTNTCPTVYKAENNDLIVQGYVEALDVPEGELAVRIPRHVVQAAMRAIASDG